MANSQRGVTITPEYQGVYHVGSRGYDGFRLRLTASDPVDMPAEIFGYRALPLQPGHPERLGFFSHICSSVDLEEFPVGEPRVNDTPPWFRLDFVDVVLRSRTEADDFYASVLDDVASLVASMNAEDDLMAQAPLRIGAPFEESSSSHA